MPTYEYACRECGRHLEVQQSFSDAPLTECPTCHGPLRKVFAAPGISFKGSGFYKNDSRSSGPRSNKAPAASEGGSDGGSGAAAGSGGDSGGSPSTPAPASTPSSSGSGSSGSGSSGDAAPSKPAAAAS